MAEANLNAGLSKPLFYNKIFFRLSVKYAFLSLIIISVGIFLFPNRAYLSTITSDNIIKITNQERQKRGMPALNSNNTLEKAARKKAEAILEKQRFEHEIEGKKFSYWIKDAEYNYKYAGENLAIDFTEAENTVNSWMASDPHRRNILNKKYREIGVFVLKGEFHDQETTVVAQIFGTQKEPLPDKPIQDSDKKNEQTTSSPPFKTTSLSSAPSAKLFFLGNISFDIRQYDLLREYKYYIFILMPVFIFCYIYLYFFFSFLFKKFRTPIRPERKY
ncbi:MAG: CAP domain-containing protein [Patescibacteria group bacterium]